MKVTGVFANVEPGRSKRMKYICAGHIDLEQLKDPMILLYAHGGLLNPHIIGCLTCFAPVPQTQTINLSFELGASAIAATCHVSETGGKKSEIIKCFPQHIIPVTESQTFKPGQEQQTTKHNSTERSKIAKRKANELIAGARTSLRDKGKEVLDTYRRLQKNQTNQSLSQILFDWQCSVQEGKEERLLSHTISSLEEEIDRIEIEVERAALLDKTAFTDWREQIRTKADLMTAMTEMKESVNTWSTQRMMSFIQLNSEEDRLSDQDTNDQGRSDLGSGIDDNLQQDFTRSSQHSQDNSKLQMCEA
jgi:hypothetical protein